MQKKFEFKEIASKNKSTFSNKMESLVELQGLTVKASRLVELEMKSCAKQKRMTDFFSINSSTI